MSSEVIAKTLICAALVSFGSWYVYEPYLFYQHPVGMMVAFLALMPFSLLMERSRNHTAHGYGQMLTVACMLYAFYAVWRGKEDKGKPHFWLVNDAKISWHAVAGGCMLFAMLTQLLMAMVFMYPRASSPFWAQAHSWSGSVCFLGGAAVALSGCYRLYSEKPPVMAAFALGCAVVVALAFPRARSKLSVF